MSTSSKSSARARTCATIAERTPRAAASALRRALARSDYAELRLDYVAPRDVRDVLERCSRSLGRCVCTLRARAEGGRFAGTEAERASMLKLISEYSPMLLDVELGTLRRNARLRSSLRASLTPVMASWHCFESTPPLGALERRLAEMSRVSARAKIVTMARGPLDAARVLSLYARARRGSLVAFCMGAEGRASRVLCTLLGAPFTYVSAGRAVAPGQMSIAEARRLMRV